MSGPFAPRPATIAISCMAAAGALLVLLAIVGLQSPVLGTALTAYNHAVEEWNSKWMKELLELKPTVCVRAPPLGCRTPEVTVDSIEGLPPTTAVRSYTPAYYELRKVLPVNQSFDLRKQFVVSVLSRGDVLEHGDVAIPVFTWRWEGTVPPERCRRMFGVVLSAVRQCVTLYMLDHICVAVNNTKMTSRLGVGCSPTQHGLQRTLGEWSPGKYTQVNASEVISNDTVVAPNVTTAPFVPYVVPQSTWTANFDGVQMRIRSAADPRIAAEYITNGTLNFAGLFPPPPFLGGLLQGYFGWAVLITGLLILFTTSACTWALALRTPKGRRHSRAYY